VSRYGGLIIAAGNSNRMGSPKAALCYPDGTPFIVKMVEMLIQVKCGPVILCLPDNANKPAFKRLLYPYPVQICFNDKPEYQQIGSILSGLKQCSTNLPGLLVWPIDAPFASPTLLELLLKSGAQNSQIGFFAPHYEGRAGHPFLLNRSFLHHLSNAGAEGGLQKLKKKYPKHIRHLDYNEPRVLCNLNSPEDYLAAFNQAPIFLPLSPYFVS